MTANKKTERFIEIWQDENKNKSRIGPHFRRRESLTIPIYEDKKRDWASLPKKRIPYDTYLQRQKKKLKLQTKMTTSGH